MKRLAFLLSILLLGTSTFAQTSYNSGDTGERVLGSYFSSDIDSINFLSGNLHLNIPLFTLPGRELPVQVSIDYNSRFLETRQTTDAYGNPITVWESFLWRKSTSFGKLTSEKTLINSATGYHHQYNGNWYDSYIDWKLTFTWIDGYGTKNTMQTQVTQHCTSWTPSPCQGANPSDAVIYDNVSAESTGSEFLKIDTSTYFSNDTSIATLYFKNGNYLKFGPRTTNAAELRTTNGNRLIANTGTQNVTNYGTALADYLPTADTLGRTITYASAALSETITLQDVNAQAKVYQIDYVNLSIPNPDPNTGNTTVKMVDKITLPNGRFYKFDYMSQGYVQKVTFPTGAYITYGWQNAPIFDAFHRWVNTRTVSRDGTAGTEQTWTYTYLTACCPTGLTGTRVRKPDGYYTHHGFSGNLEWLTQDLETDFATQIRGVQRTWTGSTNQRVQSLRTTLGPANGTNAVKETTYEYDSFNNVTKQNDYDWGSGVRGTLLRSIRRTYQGGSYPTNNIRDRVATEEIWSGDNVKIAATTYEYDNYTAPNDLVTRSGSIPGWLSPTGLRANATAVKRWLNTNNTWLTTTQRFDVLGNLVQSTDPMGHATQTDYTDRFIDASGNPFTPANPTFAYATRMTDPTGFYVDTSYNYPTGLSTKTTDSLSRTTTTTYDVLNRPLQITPPNGAWTRYTYTDVGPTDNFGPYTTKEVLIDTSANVGRVITRFDKLYRPWQTETADPAGNTFVDTQYDAGDRKWKISNAYRAGDAVVWTETEYDGADRLKKTTAPDGATLQYAYSRATTTTTDEAGNQRRYTYDGLGRMAAVEEPSPTLATPLATLYVYNAMDKVVQSNQAGQIRTFIFNSLGQLTSQTLPESGTTTYTYNADNLLLTKTDARNITTTMTYHSTQVHQVGTRTYSNGNATVSFSYNTQGQRATMSDALGTIAYTYDASTDRLIQEARTLTGIAGVFTTGYAYNLKGDLTQMTYPSGRIVNFNYATGGGCCNPQLSSVVDQTTGTTINTGFSFNSAGEMVANTLGNNVAQAYTYNNRRQLTNISTGLGGTTLMSLTYDYGTSTTNTGRVLGRINALEADQSVQYTYDSLYRLSQAGAKTGSWSIAWTFDAFGNRLTQTPQGLVVTKVGSQTFGYTNNKNTSYTYDAAGNQTNDGLHTYTFNAENQIAQMDGGTASYAYDGDGRRMKKTYNGETTYYFYSEAGLLCEFSTANTGATGGSTTDRTLYRADEKLGTAVLTFTANGSVIENNRTLPYGEPWLGETGSTNDEKFTTYVRDAESGLDYAMNRYDSTNAGRFVSPDSFNASGRLIVPTSLNRYIYVLDDPINHTDPLGLYMAVETVEWTPPPPPEDDIAYLAYNGNNQMGRLKVYETPGCGLIQTTSRGNISPDCWKKEAAAPLVDAMPSPESAPTGTAKPAPDTSPSPAPAPPVQSSAFSGVLNLIPDWFVGQGGIQGGLYGIFGGVSLSFGVRANGAGESGLYGTACLRLGTGSYVGGGFTGSVGAQNPPLDTPGVSMGFGFDAGVGAVGGGGQISVGVDSSGINSGFVGRGYRGRGWGLSFGVDVCYTR